MVTNVCSQPGLAVRYLPVLTALNVRKGRDAEDERRLASGDASGSS